MSVDGPELTAKLVYYGPEGAGKTANLQCIHRKLKKGHRGNLEIEKVSGGTYEVLPVHLGQIKGKPTSIYVYSVPGGPAHAATRGAIVQDAEGVVFVADLRPDRYQATLESLRELQGHLKAAGRSLRDILLVIQYNHHDEADENSIERLHRSIKLQPAAYFDGVASEGTGVLPALTTISKLILGQLRERSDAPAAVSAPARSTRGGDTVLRPAPVQTPEPEPEPEIRVSLTDTKSFAIESAGPVDIDDRGARIAIRLVHAESGDAVELALRIELG